MTPHFTPVTPILRMFDVAKAREFYLEFLGFTVVFEHRFEPHFPLYMRISLGGILLDLSEHHGDASPGAKVIIDMTGLADYNAMLLAKHYGYARPGLVKQPWATTMTIGDPFSNHLVFSESSDDVSR